VPLDLGRDLIVPEAEKLLVSLKALFVKFTDDAQNRLKAAAASGALGLAGRARDVLTEVEGALNDALDDLNEKPKP